MSDIHQHTTVEGERWDTVSWKAYGVYSKVPEIIEANPAVPITDRLPAGIILNIPVIETSDAKIPKEKLPPWKQDL